MQIHAISQGPHDGWVHTHGLMALGLPELEARSVPQYLMQPAAELLWRIAEYMLQGVRPVRLGDQMLVDGYGMVTLRKLDPVPRNEDHYDWERWAITDEVAAPCELCAETEPQRRRSPS